MQKAMFFEEAFKKGVLNKIQAGYILSVSTPNIGEIERQNDPFLIEIISYSGVKSVMGVGSGVKFQAQGRKMFCMIEPSSFTEKHIEPTYRSNSTTGHMPFRFKDCDMFLSKDNKFNIIIPQIPFNCYDSFTVSFPGKGDLCIIYFIFDKDINGKVLPFIEENFQTILNKSLGMRDVDNKVIAKKFISVIRKHDVWPDNK